MALDWTDKSARDIISSSDINKLAHAIQDDETNIAGKQDTLVSGENIKTINNTSILGSGNIDIQGGGGDVSTITLAGDSDVTLQATDGDIEIATEGTYNASKNPLLTKDVISGSHNAEFSNLTASNIDIDYLSGNGNLTIVDGNPSNIVFIDTEHQTETTMQGYLDEKQDTLVSGANIKTINNTSILGSGNISISGGGSDADDISYDNTTSGLTATTVQDAVDEIVSEIGDVETALSTLNTAFNSLLGGSVS